MSNDKILGYTKQQDGSWKPIVQPTGSIYTQAFIICSACECAISAHGGPRYNSVCPTCYEKIPK